MPASMALGHVVAGLVAAWWLHRGEAALWAHCATIATAAVHVLDLVDADPVVVLPVTAAPATRPSTDSPRRLREAVLLHSVVRRGPPQGALAH